jgi:hypothetical protein
MLGSMLFNVFSLMVVPFVNAYKKNHPKVNGSQESKQEPPTFSYLPIKDHWQNINSNNQNRYNKTMLRLNITKFPTHYKGRTPVSISQYPMKANYYGKHDSLKLHDDDLGSNESVIDVQCGKLKGMNDRVYGANNPIDKVCRIVFPCGYLIFLFLYLIYGLCI